MNIKKMHALGLSVSTMKTVKCSCGSTELITGYFIEEDEFQITCKVCGKDGAAKSYLGAASRLSLTNVFGDSDDDDGCIIGSL